MIKMLEIRGDNPGVDEDSQDAIEGKEEGPRGLPEANQRALRVIGKVAQAEVARQIRFARWLTGERPTIATVATNTGLERHKVNDIMRKEGMLVRPLPVVKTGTIPPTERAFFHGLSYGYPSIKEKFWSGNPYIRIVTEAHDHRSHRLLDVFEGWGPIHHNGGEERPKTSVYLSPENFGYLAERQRPGSVTLLSRTLLPPFALGVLAATMQERTHRLSLDEILGEPLARNFEAQLGIPFGVVREESSHGRKLTVRFIRNFEAVFDALMGAESVRRLPFVDIVQEVLTPSA